MPDKKTLNGSYLCREVPGHTSCKKRIERSVCASQDGSIDSNSCHGHSHNKNANLQQAMQWMREVRPIQTQSSGFVSREYPKVTWPKI